jgi:ADP-heptose:LPS heptosyltransferase
MSQRFLVIRLSSMGDIVLTTPILRALREKYPQAEIHYLTRQAYTALLQHNPHLSALHVWPPSEGLRATAWDGVIDLQKNLRTWRLRFLLRYKRWTTFPKKNLRKWLSVRLRRPFPVAHVVRRYGEALRPWDISPDSLGPLEIYVPVEVQARVRAQLDGVHPGPWLAFGLGGTILPKSGPPSTSSTSSTSWAGRSSCWAGAPRRRKRPFSRRKQRCPWWWGRGDIVS